MRMQTANFQIEKIAGNLKYVDGLVWSRNGYLVMADVRQSRLFRMTGEGKPQILKENVSGASGLAYDIQGRLYICESGARRVSRMNAQGGIESFTETFQSKRFNAPNDIVVRRDGQVYFTDPAFGSAADSRDLDYYGIYHVTPKGEVSLVAQWQTRPNGIALSADGKLLYVSDSDRHAVMAFDVGRDGETGNARDLIKGVAGVPGGLKTDVEGRLYVAGRGISVYSAQGKLERTMLVGENATNCGFGESDYESLYISSRGNVYRAAIGVKGALQY
jgi:gluconolactonase